MEAFTLRSQIASRTSLIILVTILAAGLGTAIAEDQGNMPSVSAIHPQTKVSPANVAGPWCGTVDDDIFGFGNITLSITQKGAHLKGTWSDDLGGFGNLNGKITGTAITAKLHNKASHCGLSVNGILVNPSEVAGTYAVFGCNQADGGTFDITTPTC